MTPKRLSTYENQTREPDLDTLSNIADFFGVDMDSLIGRSTNLFSQKATAPLTLAKLGERISEYREKSNLTVAALAAAADISPAYLSSVEKGERLPKLETFIIDIINALEISADAVFMDNLSCGYKDRTTYLQFELISLLPEDRDAVLNVFERLVKSYKNGYKQKKENSFQDEITENMQTDIENPPKP